MLTSDFGESMQIGERHSSGLQTIANQRNGSAQRVPGFFTEPSSVITRRCASMSSSASLPVGTPFDALFDDAVAWGGEVDYRLAAPRWQFLCHLADRRGTYGIRTARELLDWQPRVGLEEGMARTMRWLDGVPGSAPGGRPLPRSATEAPEAALWPTRCDAAARATGSPDSPGRRDPWGRRCAARGTRPRGRTASGSARAA